MKRKRKKVKAKAKRKAKAKNPQILAITNPSTAEDLETALERYREFHGEDPPSIVNVGKGKKRRTLIAIGRLVQVIYEPTTGSRKRIEWYHNFGPDAVLATDVTGRELYILAPKGDVQFDFSRGVIS